jgi:hypothetical protein
LNIGLVKTKGIAMKRVIFLLSILIGLLCGCQADRPCGLKQIGISATPLTEELIKEFWLAEETTGVVVTSVAPNSPAWSGGLRTNMVIRYVNHQETSSPEELTNIIETNEEDFLLVRVRIPRYGNRHLIIRPE